MKDYRQRIADVVLADKLSGKGAVLIEGPKWVWQDDDCGAACQERSLYG